MASVNIDGASIIRASATSGKDKGKENGDEIVVRQKLVQMQNGCICCTLRSDLLTEVAHLVWAEQKFHHVLIESSGISEPQQVAETFTTELTEAMIDADGMETDEMEVFQKVAKLGGLKTIATIDTMVTVIDAFRFFAEFDTAEFLQDRYGKDEVPEEDQPTISDLFADHIEFANVIIINKIDAVDKNTLGRVRAYVKTLNPTAKILEAKYSKVDVREILNTGKFNFAEAITGPRWLRSLHEMTIMDVHDKKRVAPKPETVEYGIGSFVYRSRRPFDPMKLYKALEGRFILLQDEFVEDAEGEDDSGDEEMSEDVSTDTEQNRPEPMDPQLILENKKACPYFQGLHRSKGIFWLATRPQQVGSWSTAGAMLTLGSEMPWFCTLGVGDWAADEETMKAIRSDFEGEWGDRRQELVFIDEKLNVDGLTELMHSCLISRADMRKWERVMRTKDLGEEEKGEKLQEMWDDSFRSEWGNPEDGDEQERHHGLSHAR
ncbi:CobW/HypB/UreG, nucleotide-binding domain-domain-containing protein [Clohesyomyces aquaticus]|uniref:CobW/HypB/UreG, nucleotide-binding domain-domain-containing protein n=1 Tax=Clohesyomyces aquaticus TaxID=1231657 RepID=A0A1Y1YTU3_9PLEO|nr:CobW/HypB/UreG, nucleotide-binding domain-domain-containing protein [Clohesyomyces aquaticus]